MSTAAVIAIACVELFLLYLAFMFGAGKLYREGLKDPDDVCCVRGRRRGGIRRFYVRRDEDVSGVSGTGIVCEGAVFSDGHAVIHWVGSKYPWTTPIPEGVEGVLEVHGHEGKTQVVWVDADGS